jgi:hypothetical protein
MVINILTYAFSVSFFLFDNKYFNAFVFSSSLALTHLFVARFIQHFMHSKGLCTSIEPFKRFIPIGNIISVFLKAYIIIISGMVQGKTYKTLSGQYVSKDDILTVDKNSAVHSVTKEPLQSNWEKMSKSKYNGTDPQEIIDQYGVDFTRILMLNFVHPRSLRNFTCNYFLSKKNRETVNNPSYHFSTDDIRDRRVQFSRTRTKSDRRESLLSIFESL